MSELLILRSDRASPCLVVRTLRPAAPPDLSAGWRAAALFLLVGLAEEWMVPGKGCRVNGKALEEIRSRRSGTMGQVTECSRSCVGFTCTPVAEADSPS